METTKSAQNSLNSNIEIKDKRLNKFNNILLIKNKNQPNQGKLVIKNSLSFIKFFNKPVKPERKNIYEEQAQKKLESYQPSIIDKLLGTAQIETKWLNYLVKMAMTEDFKAYKLKYKEYLLELEIWERLENTTEDFNKETTSLNFSNNNHSFTELQNSN